MYFREWNSNFVNASSVDVRTRDTWLLGLKLRPNRVLLGRVELCGIYFTTSIFTYLFILRTERKNRPCLVAWYRSSAAFDESSDGNERASRESLFHDHQPTVPQCLSVWLNCPPRTICPVEQSRSVTRNSVRNSLASNTREEVSISSPSRSRREKRRTISVLGFLFIVRMIYHRRYEKTMKTLFE